jgi:hypothetical protein
MLGALLFSCAPAPVPAAAAKGEPLYVMLSQLPPWMGAQILQDCGIPLDPPLWDRLRALGVEAATLDLIAIGSGATPRLLEPASPFPVDRAPTCDELQARLRTDPDPISVAMWLRRSLQGLDLPSADRDKLASCVAGVLDPVVLAEVLARTAPFMTTAPSSASLCDTLRPVHLGATESAP